MVCVVTYSEIEHDMQKLIVWAKDVIAGISEEYWEVKEISSGQELQRYLSAKPLLHLLIYDLCGKRALEYLAQIRMLYPQVMIMLLADASVSPMEYIRPDLQISSLLLRPYEKIQAYDVLHKFLGGYAASLEAEKSGAASFVIETREGRLDIPYEQIYFFEAREKKVYACIGKKEYGFYSSLEKTAETLPDYFARCHRGFIVNTKKIRKIALSQNMIYLCDDYVVPLSRSYKAALKGRGK